MFKQPLRMAACKAGAVLCLTVGLGACATTPLPRDKFELAQASVQRAEQSGADEFAPVELRAARDKLSAAESSPHSSQGAIAAAHLADEADADARVAEAKSQAARSRRAAEELDRSLAALREETNPSTP
jgi:hypothetical protein